MTSPHNPLRKLSMICAWAMLTGVASAAPYIVYSGSIAGCYSNTAGAWKTVQTLYLIADLADTSNYALYLEDPVEKQGQLFTYPIANATTEESNSNFFGGVAGANGKAGLGVLCTGFEAIDASNNNQVVVYRLYLTGPMTTASTVLVPARKKALTVNVVFPGYEGTVTFPVSDAVTSGGMPFPKTISGTLFTHSIATDGSLQKSSLWSKIKLSVNSQYTTIANIGAEYSPDKQHVYAPGPVSLLPVGTTDVQAITTWFESVTDAMLIPLRNQDINPGLPNTGSVN